MVLYLKFSPYRSANTLFKNGHSVGFVDEVMDILDLCIYKLEIMTTYV